MINKQTLLVEVWCTLISLNFYLFQNNFASLRGPKWVLFRLQKFLLEAYTGLLHHVNKKESTPGFTQNHHGCLVTSNGLPANDFLYLLSETVINVISTKSACCADSDLLYISKLSPFYLASHTH